jgi:hypothetical protein
MIERGRWTMSLRSIAALVALALPLCGCATTTGKTAVPDQGVDQRRNAALEELERRHDATMMTGIGGGGM